MIVRSNPNPIRQKSDIRAAIFATFKDKAVIAELL